MKARDGSDATLTQKEVNDPEEILGVWQAPINDGKKQTEVLKEKVVQGEGVQGGQVGKDKSNASSQHAHNERNRVPASGDYTDSKPM